MLGPTSAVRRVIVELIKSKLEPVHGLIFRSRRQISDDVSGALAKSALAGGGARWI